MKHEEYLKKEKELKKEFENKKVELMKEFVNANNPYKTGDKVTDHIGSIIIEKIGYSLGFYDKPYAIYTGLELKKDGTPTKKQSRRSVHQTNVI